MLPTGKIIRRLRDLLPDWEAQRPDGYEITRAPSGAHAIAVAAGTAPAGDPDPDAYPSNRSAKGTKTKEAVARNNQASFYTLNPDVWLEDPTTTADRMAAPDQTWILLFRVHFGNVTGAEVRYELSLPAVFHEGYVVKWKERIVCAPVQYSAFGVDPSPMEDDPFDAEDFEVPRRSG